ncbi:MAG: polyprenyl synthetase family protein, partial [Nitrospinae bacterium]|nr:polyprenyl synthetase family protein [Nitrospinota bacterium]
MPLSAYFTGVAREVDAALERLVPSASIFPPRVHEAMRYSLFAGGKRLRPMLAVAACEAVGCARARVMAFAAALELIHTYTLIHDDLPAMDDDDLRRGRATCHKQFDEATAILAGDALLTLAFEVMSTQANFPGAAAEALLTVTSETARGAGSLG